MVGYIVAGLTKNLLLTLGVSIACLVIVLFVLHNVAVKKEQLAERSEERRVGKECRL